MPDLSLDLESVKDTILAENLRRIKEYVKSSPLLLGDFKFREQTFNQAETAFKIPHGLGFLPNDIMVSSVKWTGTAGTVTINYSSTDATNFYVTITQPGTVRFLVGSFRG